jgi:predicted RNA-binding protein YlxR (DUF448 family)
LGSGCEETVEVGARTPQRTCIGCRRTAVPECLVRLVRDGGGKVALDLFHRRRGRGAWVHPALSCLRRSARSVGHALRAQPTEDLATELSSALASAIAQGRARAVTEGHAPRWLARLEKLAESLAMNGERC